MPYDGFGNFTPDITFVDDTPATAADQNTQDQDFAAGLTNAITRDGQSPPSAPIPMGGQRITGLANPINPTDAVNLQSAAPPGIVFMSAAAVAPTGYLLCNGAAVSRTTYAALFTAIGTGWGVGDGTTTFNVPNLIGHMPIGAGVRSGFTTRVLGVEGGSETHTQTLAEIATHNHGVNDPTHIHALTAADTGPTVALGSGAFGASETGKSTTASVTGITIQNAGSATPMNIMNPYAPLTFVIKT